MCRSKGTSLEDLCRQLGRVWLQSSQAPPLMSMHLWRLPLYTSILFCCYVQLVSHFLCSLNETFMTFQPMLTRPPSHSDLTTSPTPSVLDTHNRVWVWLPVGYWGNQTTRCSNYQKSVLDIGQVCKHIISLRADFNPFFTGFSDTKGLPQVGPHHRADSALRDTSVCQPLHRLAKLEL